MRPGVERAAVGAGVDAEGEAADHDQPRRGQLAPQLAGDLAAVGGGPPGADDRHRAERLEPVEQAPGRRGRSAPRARRRRRAGRPGRGRRGGSRPSTAPPAAPRRAGAPASAATRASSCAATFGAAASTRSSLREPQQFRRARAGRAGRDPLDVGAEERQQPGAAQAVGAGARLSSSVPPPQLQRLGHLLLADRLGAGEVGDRLRQPQRPVVGAAAEPLARVELGEQRRGVAARARTRAPPPASSRRCSDPARAARSWRSRAAAHPLAHRRRGLPRRAADLRRARLAHRGEDVDAVGERAAQLALVALDGDTARSCSPGRSRRARRDRGWRRRPA